MEEVSLQDLTAEISLQSIQAIKKEREKSIAKALSIPRWKDGKNILPSKERHDNFQLKLFSVSCLVSRSSFPFYYVEEGKGRLRETMS